MLAGQTTPRNLGLNPAGETDTGVGDVGRAGRLPIDDQGAAVEPLDPLGRLVPAALVAVERQDPTGQRVAGHKDPPRRALAHRGRRLDRHVDRAQARADGFLRRFAPVAPFPYAYREVPLVQALRRLGFLERRFMLLQRPLLSMPDRGERLLERRTLQGHRRADAGGPEDARRFPPAAIWIRLVEPRADASTLCGGSPTNDGSHPAPAAAAWTNRRTATGRTSSGNGFHMADW